MHPANAASEKLRASKPTHQPKSGLRLAANPAGSREAARARRRGDRIRKFAAMRMSAFGTKLTKAGSKSRSAAGSCVLIVGGSTGGGWFPTSIQNVSGLTLGLADRAAAG